MSVDLVRSCGKALQVDCNLVHRQSIVLHTNKQVWILFKERTENNVRPQWRQQGIGKNA